MRPDAEESSLEMVDVCVGDNFPNQVGGLNPSEIWTYSAQGLYADVEFNSATGCVDGC